MVIVTTTLKTQKKDHFNAIMISLSHLRDFVVIHMKLTMRQQRLFKRTCIGHFLDLDLKLTFSGNLVHHMLLYKVETDDAE